LSLILDQFTRTVPILLVAALGAPLRLPEEIGAVTDF
jgi:hypothetical protein